MKPWALQDSQDIDLCMDFPSEKKQNAGTTPWSCQVEKDTPDAYVYHH